jgi:hypothetical protein
MKPLTLLALVTSIKQLFDVRKEAVVLLRGGSEVFSDEDRDDKRVDGQDTGHDDWDEALQRPSAKKVVGLRELRCCVPS